MRRLALRATLAASAVLLLIMNHAVSEARRPKPVTGGHVVAYLYDGDPFATHSAPCYPAPRAARDGYSSERLAGEERASRCFYPL